MSISYQIQDEQIEEQKPQKPIKLSMYDFKQCKPNACSGQILLKQNKIKAMSPKQLYKGILLSSETQTYISQADKPIIEQFGLACIDCSWNKILIDNSVPIKQLKCKNHRLIPFLIAANTINYGRPYHLNDVEALASVLYLIGREEEARNILKGFKYGDEFFRLNIEYLDQYKLCQTSEETIQMQNKIIKQLQDEDRQKHEEQQEEEY